MAVEEDGILRLYVKVWYELSTNRMFSGLRSVWMRLRSCKTMIALAVSQHLQVVDHLQATLVNNCRAKVCMCELGNGVKLLFLRKSKTLCPYRSVTIQIWFLKSKHCRK